MATLDDKSAMGISIMDLLNSKLGTPAGVVPASEQVKNIKEGKPRFGLLPAPAPNNTAPPPGTQTFTGSTRYSTNPQGYAVEGTKQPGAPTAEEVAKFNYGIHNYKKDNGEIGKNISSAKKGSSKGLTISPVNTPPVNFVQGIRGGLASWEQPEFEKTPPKSLQEAQIQNRDAIVTKAMRDVSSYLSKGDLSAEDASKYAAALSSASNPMKEIPEAAYREGEVPYAGDVLKSGIGFNEARSEEARASARLHQANVGKVGAETRNIGLSNKESKQRADEIKSLSVHTITDELGQTKTVYDTGYGMEQYNKLHGIPAPEPKTDADILAEARVKAIRNPSQRPRIRQYLINNGFDPKAIDEILGK